MSHDDSTLRSYCSLIENGGSLRPGVREPKYLADPSHRAKVWVKPVFKMVKQTKKQDEVKKIDAMRLKNTSHATLPNIAREILNTSLKTRLHH